jgi:hypothetical protein
MLKLDRIVIKQEIETKVVKFRRSKQLTFQSKSKTEKHILKVFLMDKIVEIIKHFEKKDASVASEMQIKGNNI